MKLKTYINDFITKEKLNISVLTQDIYILIDFLINYYSRKIHMGSTHQMSKCIELLRYIVQTHAEELEQKQLFERCEMYIQDEFHNMYMKKSQCMFCFN